MLALLFRSKSQPVTFGDPFESRNSMKMKRLSTIMLAVFSQKTKSDCFSDPFESRNSMKTKRLSTIILFLLFKSTSQTVTSGDPFGKS